MKLFGTTLFMCIMTVIAYDFSEKECWNVALSNSNYFCYNFITWPISKAVYYDSDNRDKCKYFRIP